MRLLIITLTTLIVILLVAAGFAPSYLSSHGGNQVLAKIINSQISGDVSFDRVRLSWTGKQSVKNLKIKDHTGALILSLDYAETQTDLITLLLGGKPGESQVRKLNLHLVQQADRTSNLQQALESDIPPPLAPDATPLVIDLENVNGMISLGAPNIPKKIHLVGTTKQGDIAGSFNIEIDSLSDDKHMIMAAEIKQFPIAVLDFLIASQNPDFGGIATTAIGKTLDLELSNTYREGISFFKLDVKSQGVQAEFHGQLNDRFLTVTTPSELSILITPALLEYFTPSSPLDHPAKAVFTLDQLKIPATRDLTDLGIKFHLNKAKSDPVIARYLDDTDITIDTKTGSLPHFALENEDIRIDLLLDAANKKASGTVVIAPDHTLNIVASLEVDNDINLSLKGEALNLKAHFKDKGNFQIEGEAKDFPLGKICRFICFDTVTREQVHALFGETVSGKIDANIRYWSGSVAAALRGLNSELDFDGYLRQGILTLNRPLTAKVTITPELGSVVLDDIFPLFGGIVESDEPITLTISPEHFSVPLNPFMLSHVSIGHGLLSLNHVTFNKTGELENVLELLNPNNEQELYVWFTPLHFSFNQGSLELKRIDMLIMEEYPIASWGKINFIKDRVSLTIGLSARAIQQAFNVKDLSPKYMLQLSLKGSLNNATIDRRKAAAKISSLVAKTQGIEGSIIGTVIDVASGNLKEPTPPEPTTNPLPWDDGTSKPKSAPRGKSKRKASYILDKATKAIPILR